MSRFILTIDPGKMTGWALYDREKSEFTSGQTDFNDTCKLLHQEAAEKMLDLVIVAESFIINANTLKNSQAPWSLELIGVCRYMSRAYTGRDLVLQSPAAAKRFVSDERLRALEWWAPAKGHANDAARHLCLLLATRGWLDENTLRLLAST